MQSTMINAPLATGAIVRHGTAIHGSARVRTLQPDGTVRSGTFAEVSSRSAQLAHALRACGACGQQRRVGC